MMTIKNLMDLEGRRVLLTGAAGGIGKVVAQTLNELGAELILVDRAGSDYSALKDLKKLSIIDCDLESESDREALIKTVSNQTGLDVLINNAAFVGTSGLSGWVTKFEDQSVETWRRAFEVNLTACFHLTKGFAPLLKKSAHASVINVGSIYGSFGPDYSLYEDTAMGNPAAYAASKGGLLQLTRWLSTTLAPSVRVNAISPGGVFRNQPESFVKKYEARVPLKRMATEEDFRGAMVFLATDMSRYVTGQNIAVDGGWGVW